MVTTTGTLSPTADNVTDVTDVADANVSAVLWSKLADLDNLVEDGQRGQALRQARRLLDSAEGAARAELADLVATLEQQRDDDWIPPQRRDLTRWVPPGRVRVHRRAPHTPASRILAPTATAGREGDAAADAYLAERGGVDDPLDRRSRRRVPAGNELDYDLAAPAPLRGRPCLNLTCRVERTPRTCASPTACAATAAPTATPARR